MVPASRAVLVVALSVLIVACAGPTTPSASTPTYSAQLSLASAVSIPLTAGTLQFYSGDPGSADLVGSGFELKSTASGSRPITVTPVILANFSTGVALSDWGPALVNGVALHGDPAGQARAECGSAVVSRSPRFPFWRRRLQDSATVFKRL